jgi:hypothetical protein
MGTSCLPGTASLAENAGSTAFSSNFNNSRLLFCKELVVASAKIFIDAKKIYARLRTKFGL